MSDYKSFLNLTLEAAMLAGKKTLKYYGENIDVEIKDDNSPLTQADLDANKIIEDYLVTTNIPILSEESKPEEYETRKTWDKLWIIDPLDGTKEFINKSDEYTVNIALVVNDIPVHGVVYAPARDLLYYAVEDYGAYKVEKASEREISELQSDEFRVKLPIESDSDETIVVASKSHRTDETNNVISKLVEELGSIDIQSFGSSLKLCMVAEGKAHIYPRIGPTMEWDTAASHAVVLCSGKKICKYPGFEKLSYNKEDLVNPWFIVYSPEKEKAVKAI